MALGPRAKMGIVGAALLVAAAVLAILLTRVLIPALLPAVDPEVLAFEPPPEPVVPEEPDAAEAASEIDIDELPVGLDLGEGQTEEPGRGGRHASRDAGPIDLGDGIVRTGPGTYVVSRELVDRSVENGSAIGGSYAVPNIVDGHIEGFRVTAVGGLFGRLGVQRGDIITHVNGRPINSPDSALAAASAARHADRVHVTLKRGGGTMGLRYEVR